MKLRANRETKLLRSELVIYIIDWGDYIEIIRNSEIVRNKLSHYNLKRNTDQNIRKSVRGA